MFGNGQSYAQAMKNLATLLQANTTGVWTIHLRIVKANEPFKEKPHSVKCLQRDNRDHLLTPEHLHHKTSLLAKGFITVDQNPC